MTKINKKRLGLIHFLKKKCSNLPWKVALNGNTFRLIRLPLAALATHFLLGQVQFVAGIAIDLQHAAVCVGGFTAVTTYRQLVFKTSLV